MSCTHGESSERHPCELCQLTAALAAREADVTRLIQERDSVAIQLKFDSAAWNQSMRDRVHALQEAHAEAARLTEELRDAQQAAASHEAKLAEWRDDRAALAAALAAREGELREFVHAVSRILADGRETAYPTTKDCLEGLGLFMKLWLDAIAVATPLFQSGGRWADLLTPGQSITSQGPQALSAHAEALEAEVTLLAAERDAAVSEAAELRRSFDARLAVFAAGARAARERDEAQMKLDVAERELARVRGEVAP
jgi:hypothetical protein